MIFTNDMITAIIIADPNDEKLKLAAPTKKEVICKINALITKVNNPNVNKVKGIDKNIMNGLTNRFSTERTKLATTAVQILFTNIIFGKITAREINVSVLTTIR
ncbi:hypothetical protein EMQU_1952 [Enterococcus mundtii QU 25]|uniref:Uncharacterized protein n=1 Tax=Enterococcus mundtii TaxID=53346 RepID=A0AAI8R7W7_ENTMU|nr:hypothetical protein EMQU_1952 [Enterococcus mundtii QU 25]BBM13844.1 uncharacterized protein EM151A_0603 [Enterococcus mundtii]GKS53748.1 hypothetical protein EMLAB_03630 [Enterococcus mundtii]